MNHTTRWVFPAAKGSGHYVGLPKHWDAVRARANAIALRRAEREGHSLTGVLGFDGIRLHDLRHSFASFAVQSGGSLYLVGKVLGHKQSRTTERYAHSRDEPLLATAELAAQRIARALAGSKKADRRRSSAASSGVTRSRTWRRRGRSAPSTIGQRRDS
jgi:integrase